MIPHGVEIFIGLEPIDLRWGFDRLSGVVAERIGRDARSGALFVFFGKHRHALKIVFFDGNGLCLPEVRDEHSPVVEIDERMLEDLLDGIDIEEVSRNTRTRAPH
jgi:transposase